MSKKFLGLNSIDSIKEYVNKQIGAAITGGFVPPTNPDTPEVVQWTIGDDGYWYANGKKTKYKAIGEQGPAGPQGNTGPSGERGVSTFKSIVFKRSNTDISNVQPTGGDWDDPIASGWHDTIPDGTGIIWMSTRTFYSIDSMNTNEKWTLPKILQDSNSFDVAYGTSAVINKDGSYNTSGLPMKNGYADPSGKFSPPWYDEPNNEEIWFMATATNDNGQWSKWTISKIKGENGNNGTSISIKNTYESLDAFKAVFGNDLNIAPDNLSDCYLVTIDNVEHMFVWIELQNKWIDQGPFSGIPGVSQFLHIKYAKHIEFNTNGTLNVSKCITTDKYGESTVDALWIGIYTDTNDMDPTLNPNEENYLDENWNKYKWIELVPENLVNDRVKTTFGAYHISSNHIAGKTIDTAVDNNGNNNYIDLIAGTEYVTFTKDKDGNEVQNDPKKAVDGDKGPAWQLRTDGAGYLAKGNIRWDGNGDVTFGPDVKIAWDSENWDSKIPKVPTNDEIAGIAATTITDTFLATKNIYAKGIQGNVISGHTIQSGESTNGKPNWKIDKEGVGYFAKGNFEWDADGNVTLGGLNEDNTRPIITIADAWKTDADGNIFAKNNNAKFGKDGEGYIGKDGEGLSWDSEGNITINSQLKYNFQTIYIGDSDRPEGLKISDVNKYLIKEGAASRIIDTTNDIKSINIDWWNSDILKESGLSNRLIDIDIINGTSNTIAIKGTSNTYKNTIIYAPFRKSHDYVFPQNNFTLGEISNQSSTTTNQIYLLPGTTLELQLYNLEGDNNVVGYVKNISSFQLVSSADSSSVNTTNVLCSMAPEHNNVPVNNVDIDSVNDDRQNARYTLSHEFMIYKDANIDDLMEYCKQNDLNISLFKQNLYINDFFDGLNQYNSVNTVESSDLTYATLFSGNDNDYKLNYEGINKLNLLKFAGYSTITFNGVMEDPTAAQINFIKSAGLYAHDLNTSNVVLPYMLKMNYYIPEYNKLFKSKPIRLFALSETTGNLINFEFENTDINMFLSTLFNSSNKRLNICDYIECKHIINVETDYNGGQMIDNRNMLNISKSGTSGKTIQMIIDFNENQFDYGTNIVKPSSEGTWFKVGQPTEQDNKYIYELTIYANDSGEPREANIEMQCKYDGVTYTRNFKVIQDA